MITRFAPSPTGPLHLGHAYSALLAHDMARASGGTFLLRMEDTDRQRSKPAWDALIREDLKWLGVVWDGAILRQSERPDIYLRALHQLERSDLVYPCSCSRSDIRAALDAPQEGALPDVYPGLCKNRPMASRKPGDALRLHLDKALDRLNELTFEESGALRKGLHKVHDLNVQNTVGDLVLCRRGDNEVAYFLASAIDDAAQNITHVVRGMDLFDFTAIQVILLSLLNLPVPVYHHHRLIRDENGKRLAKRDDARAISKFREEGASPDDIRKRVGLA